MLYHRNSNNGWKRYWNMDFCYWKCWYCYYYNNK